MDGIGILELIDHDQTIVGANIVLHFFIISQKAQEYLLHVIIGNDMVIALIGYEIVAPNFCQTENGGYEWLENGKCID